jgi:Rrf2 family iron-sulfur cluster assembly transcriptional regulator
MKITAQDEYGIRILLRIARADAEEGMSIAQLSEAEGLSGSYVAKMTRALRLGGFISSTRGQKGGYVLAQVAEEIRMNEVLKAMDGAIFDNSFCKNHSGQQRICTNSVDCSVRSLWRTLSSSPSIACSNRLPWLTSSAPKLRPAIFFRILWMRIRFKGKR